ALRREGAAVPVPRPEGAQAHLPPPLDRPHQRGRPDERHHVLAPHQRPPGGEHPAQPEGARRPRRPRRGSLQGGGRAGHGLGPRPAPPVRPRSRPAPARRDFSYRGIGSSGHRFTGPPRTPQPVPPCPPPPKPPRSTRRSRPSPPRSRRPRSRRPRRPRPSASASSAGRAAPSPTSSGGWGRRRRSSAADRKST